MCNTHLTCSYHQITFSHLWCPWAISFWFIGRHLTTTFTDSPPFLLDYANQHNNDSLPFLLDCANKQVKKDFPFTIFRSEHGRYSTFRQKCSKKVPIYILLVQSQLMCKLNSLTFKKCWLWTTIHAHNMSSINSNFQRWKNFILIRQTKEVIETPSFSVKCRNFGF